MGHGGDIYEKKIEYDFSVSINPMGAPAEVIDVLKDSISHVSEYPDIRQRRLKEALAASEKCNTDEVFGGSGASEILFAIVQMVKPATALLISPCFSGYGYALGILDDCKIKYCPEAEIETVPDRIDADTGIVFIANPNNPTGRNIDKKLLFKIAERCERTGTCLVADECFLPLSEYQYSLSAIAVKQKNLFVVKAFTKTFAIPGVRIGYVISSADNISRLTGYLPEWNLSIQAMEAGIACAGMMLDTDYLERSYHMVKKERRYLERNLKKTGIEFISSDTCYILCQSKRNLYDKLLEKGFLIRDCGDFKGLRKGWFRIAVKDHEANKSLLEKIYEITKS